MNEKTDDFLLPILNKHTKTKAFFKFNHTYGSFGRSDDLDKRKRIIFFVWINIKMLILKNCPSIAINRQNLRNFDDMGFFYLINVS